MKKHSARVAPLSACNSPVLTLTKVEGNAGGGGGLYPGGVARFLAPGHQAAWPGGRCSRGSVPAVQLPVGVAPGSSRAARSRCCGSEGLPRVRQPPRTGSLLRRPLHICAAAAVASATSQPVALASGGGGFPRHSPLAPHSQTLAS